MNQNYDVSASVRERLCQLNKELAPGVAEDVALAMIRGAAEAIGEMTKTENSLTIRRLLEAIRLDPKTAVDLLFH